ncbi:hypothetical protein DFS34DRAFT_160170 [Phlyctochytrium arcticum]|nr:hypothetical protein DFS34DRAFT_160170 [Phlyctochytrium arcticum]
MAAPIIRRSWRSFYTCTSLLQQSRTPRSILLRDLAQELSSPNQIPHPSRPAVDELVDFDAEPQPLYTDPTPLFKTHHIPGRHLNVLREDAWLARQAATPPSLDPADAVTLKVAKSESPDLRRSHNLEDFSESEGGSNGPRLNRRQGRMVVQLEEALTSIANSEEYRGLLKTENWTISKIIPKRNSNIYVVYWRLEKGAKFDPVRTLCHSTHIASDFPVTFAKQIHLEILLKEYRTVLRTVAARHLKYYRMASFPTLEFRRDKQGERVERVQQVFERIEAELEGKSKDSAQ